jgi:hypothetical protein
MQYVLCHNKLFQDAKIDAIFNYPKIIDVFFNSRHQKLINCFSYLWGDFFDITSL